MTVATIQIPLKDEVAEAYNAASLQTRERLNRLFGFLIQEFVESTPDSLLALMDEMSEEAEVNGLTDEVIESILNDD